MVTATVSVHSRRRVMGDITARYYLTAALKLMTIFMEKAAGNRKL